MINKSEHTVHVLNLSFTRLQAPAYTSQTTIENLCSYLNPTLDFSVNAGIWNCRPSCEVYTSDSEQYYHQKIVSRGSLSGVLLVLAIRADLNGVLSRSHMNVGNFFCDSGVTNLSLLRSGIGLAKLHDSYLLIGKWPLRCCLGSTLLPKHKSRRHRRGRAGLFVQE